MIPRIHQAEVQVGVGYLVELSSPASFSVPFTSAFLARPVTHFPSLRLSSHCFRDTLNAIAFSPAAAQPRRSTSQLKDATVTNKSPNPVGLSLISDAPDNKNGRELIVRRYHIRPLRVHNSGSYSRRARTSSHRTLRRRTLGAGPPPHYLRLGRLFGPTQEAQLEREPNGLEGGEDGSSAVLFTKQLSDNASLSTESSNTFPNEFTFRSETARMSFLHPHSLVDSESHLRTLHHLIVTSIGVHLPPTHRTPPHALIVPHSGLFRETWWQPLLGCIPRRWRSPTLIPLSHGTSAQNSIG